MAAVIYDTIRNTMTITAQNNLILQGGGVIIA